MTHSIRADQNTECGAEAMKHSLLILMVPRTLPSCPVPTRGQETDHAIGRSGEVTILKSKQKVFTHDEND